MIRVMVVAKPESDDPTQEQALIARAAEVLSRAAAGLALEGLDILISISEEAKDEDD